MAVNRRPAANASSSPAPASILAVDLIAFHPVEAFRLSHPIAWFRGVSGTSGSIPVAHPFDNEGTPHTTSNAVTFGALIGPNSRSSFALQSIPHVVVTDTATATATNELHNVTRKFFQ